MFREINLNTHEEYPIFASCNNISQDGYITENNINKSIIEKTMVETKSFLKIEDHGEKQFGKSIVENYFGSVRIYEISMTDENNFVKIKCFRRYSNFVKLDQALRQQYPFYIIPLLPPKNPLMKIKNYPADQEFFANREKGLNYYINFLFSYNNLSSSNYFKKFINDPEMKLFSIIKDTITSKMKNIFFGFFQKIEDKSINEVSEELKVLVDFNVYFNNSIDLIENFIKIVTKFIQNFKHASSNYEDLSMNFFYIRDVEFEDFVLEKSEFNVYSKKLKGIAKINKNYSTIFEENFLNILTNFLSQLKGIQESIISLNTFISKYNQVERTCNEKETSKELEEVRKEFKEAREFKDHFIKTLINEISDFQSKNKNFVLNILQEFKNLYLYMNLHQKNLILTQENDL